MILPENNGGKNSGSHLDVALSCCSMARALNNAGDYEAARDALGALWKEIGQRPSLYGLDNLTAAEVLLRVGVLTGHIGRAQQSTGSQEIARNLIGESTVLFELAGETAKMAEAAIELSRCYWREGAFNAARVTVRKALDQIPDENRSLRGVALLLSATIEISANQLKDASDILTEAASVLQTSTDHNLKGRLHLRTACLLIKLGRAEQRSEYLEVALKESRAANCHFEQAGNRRLYAMVENNIGLLNYELMRFDEAHYHLERAKEIFVNLKDSGHVAQVNESLARVLSAQNRTIEAEELIQHAINTLEKGGQQVALAEALTTQGIILARLGHQEQAFLMHKRAIEIAAGAISRDPAPNNRFKTIPVKMMKLARKLLGRLDQHHKIA